MARQPDPPVWAQAVIVAFGSLLGAFFLVLFFGKDILLGGISRPRISYSAVAII
jgi:hypothetical protein